MGVIVNLQKNVVISEETQRMIRYLKHRGVLPDQGAEHLIADVIERMYSKCHDPNSEEIIEEKQNKHDKLWNSFDKAMTR